LVDIAAAFDGDVAGEELEGDDFEDGEAILQTHISKSEMWGTQS